MTTKFIDVTGKTEDEAISKALSELGRDRDEVSVEILERAKKGFLGLGSTPAKVRVTYEVAEEPVKVPEKKTAPVRPAETKTEGTPSAPVREASRPAAERPERKKSGRGRGERREQADRQSAAVPAAAPVPEAPGELCSDEKAQQITAFLEGLLQHMGSEAQVKVYKSEEGRYKVILEGDKPGALIGRRGETLDAIQQLTNYSVNRGSDKRVRIHVDTENYRLQREQNLQHLAHKVAAKAVKYKRNVTLEPMNAYERHVIHTALQDVPNVTTYSMGTEPNRRVIVAYDRGGER